MNYKETTPTPQHKDTTLDEILWQNIQFTELGYFPEKVPDHRNWVNVMGKVYCFDFTEAKQALLQWHNKQNVHLLDKLAMLVKASQEVNQAFHGRPDCKSCNVQEQLIEIIEAERKRINKTEKQ